jgi:hypothetical protein
MFTTPHGAPLHILLQLLASKLKPTNRRGTLQVITGTFPCGKWLHTIKKQPTSEGERCRKAWMASGKTGTVPDETVGHIQIVQCVT